MKQAMVCGNADRLLCTGESFKVHCCKFKVSPVSTIVYKYYVHEVEGISITKSVGLPLQWAGENKGHSGIEAMCKKWSL